MCARGVALLVCLGLLAVPVAAQRGALVLQRNLAEIVQDSFVIVRGRVVAVRAEPHPQLTGLDSVVVTFDVIETLKGPVERQHIFRLFVGDARDKAALLGYKTGQELLLFMTQPSSYGFSSPAGLEQGRFRFTADVQGNRSVVNGRNNGDLFRDIQKSAPKLETELTNSAARQLMTQHAGGPIPFNEFKTIVQTLIAGSQQ
jgi:hypothetical protein